MSLFRRLLNRWMKHPKTFATVLAITSLAVGSAPGIIFLMFELPYNSRAYIIIDLIVKLPAMLLMTFAISVILLCETISKHHQMHAHKPDDEDLPEQDLSSQ